MQSSLLSRLFSISVILSLLLGASLNVLAQAKPQKPTAPVGNQKKNQRPSPKTEEELKKEEEERKRAEEEKNAVADDEIVKIETNIVNVDAVVYNKKTGQIITGLKEGKFRRF